MMATIFSPLRMRCNTSNVCEISKNSPERTSIHAFSTVDTLAFINVLYAVFIFADSFYRTRLFTRYGNIYNSVIRTTLVTNTATDTCVMVNHCLTVFLETYRIFRAVHVTTTCHASATKVGYFIIDLLHRKNRPRR